MGSKNDTINLDMETRDEYILKHNLSEDVYLNRAETWLQNTIDTPENVKLLCNMRSLQFSADSLNLPGESDLKKLAARLVAKGWHVRLTTLYDDEWDDPDDIDEGVLEVSLYGWGKLN